LPLYVGAAEEALSLWEKARRAEQEQIVREQRIRSGVKDAEEVVNTWRGNETVVEYREARLDELDQRRETIENGIANLEHAGTRDLIEQTAALQVEAEKLSDEARHCEQTEFPDIIDKDELRERFIDAIVQSVEDAFERLNMDVDHRAEPQLVDASNPESPKQVERGSGSRKFIAEVDLEGTCHCWWDGYQGREHVNSIEALQDVLAADKTISISMSSPTFRGDPEFDEPPPPPSKRPIKKPRESSRRMTGKRGTATPQSTKKPKTHERNT